MEKVHRKQTRGITLIALVVTIVVLLILAGVSINLVLGNNGIISKAKEAREKTSQGEQKEKLGLETLYNQMLDAETNLGEDNSETNVIKIGDKVNYKYDDAQAYTNLTSAVCGERNTSTVEQTKNLEWQVLNIDKEKGKIDLISSKGTDSSMNLCDSRGFQNGLVLMNNICAQQYSNKALNVKARNVSLSDIEKHLTKAGLKARKDYTNEIGIQYGTTKAYEDDEYNIHSSYPQRYAGQIGAGINSDGTTRENIEQPNIDDLTNPDPYGGGLAENFNDTIKFGNSASAFTKSNSTKKLIITQTAYDIKMTEENYGAIYKLFGYDRENPDFYWIATSCVNAGKNNAEFGFYKMFWGGISFTSITSSTPSGFGTTAGKFRPVVSIDASLIEEKVNDVWQIKGIK